MAAIIVTLADVFPSLFTDRRALSFKTEDGFTVKKSQWNTGRRMARAVIIENADAKAERLHFWLSRLARVANADNLTTDEVLDQFHVNFAGDALIVREKY